MPGSVANATPTAVLLPSLCRTFAHTREYPVVDNEYRNGESQRSVQASTSRKKWKLTKRLTPSQLAALRNFYDARGGSLEPFYFYDPYETNPKFSYDPTGMAVTGRYTVRFNGDWSQLVGPGRSNVQIELIEIA
jgi:phage-related protein